MDISAQIKKDMQSFYASEAGERGSEDWIRAGGTARVPESRSSHYFIDRKVETALALAPGPAEGRVLELGCSFGHMTFLLARRFREVVAVDLSAESLALARRRAEHYGVGNVRFVGADAERLDAFESATFDAVYSFSTLRFCPYPAAALAEIHRVLRPGGRAAVDVPNRYCPWYGPLKRAIGIEGHIHDRLFAPGEIRSMMRAAGFAEVRTRQILFTTKRAPDRVLSLFKLMDRVLEPLPMINRLSGIVMAAGRKSAAA